MTALLRAFSFAIFGSFLVSINAFGETLTTVYFVPFDIETYVPITPATITCLAWEKWTISDKSQVSDLTNILKQGIDAPFDSNRIRVKVSALNQTYYIDSDGVVQNGMKNYRIDKYEFLRFGESIRPDQRLSIKEHHCPNMGSTSN